MSSDRDVRERGEITDPRSNDRRAWLSLNLPTVKAIERATSSVSHPSIRSSVAELRKLALSTEWTTLNDIRGEVFHRSRPESSINFGVDAESGYGEPITNADGAVIGYAAGPLVRYSDGDPRWETEAAATRAALARVAKASSSIARSLVDAVEPLTRGQRTFGVVDGQITTHEHLGGTWDESLCQCCTGDV